MIENHQPYPLIVCFHSDAPVNVKVVYRSNVKEGEDVSLKCTSDAHPASSFEWRSDTGAQLHKGKLYILKNVPR